MLKKGAVRPSVEESPKQKHRWVNNTLQKWRFFQRGGIRGFSV